MSDPDLLLAALEPADRATVTRWSRLLGLGDDGWAYAPGFRQTVELVAIATVADALRARDPSLSDRGAWLEAGELVLGDPDGATPPADVAARRLRRWLERARTKCPPTDSANRVGSHRKET